MSLLQSQVFEWIIPFLIHIGALFYLICFMFRDQLWLRIFAVLGDAVYTAFYFTAAELPLWSAIVYSTLNMLINMAMIGFILNDRRMSSFDDDDLTLYQNFTGMTPGDFRRLRKIGIWNKSEADQTLTEEGQPLGKLHYVVDGPVEVRKGDRFIPVNTGLFIGEVAYLNKSPASATVIAKAGARYISWSHADLQKILSRHHTLQQSLSSLLSADLALKVAKS
jgi:Cyclic nucleotide-binding domain